MYRLQPICYRRDSLVGLALSLLCLHMFLSICLRMCKVSTIVPNPNPCMHACMHASRLSRCVCMPFSDPQKTFHMQNPPATCMLTHAAALCQIENRASVPPSLIYTNGPPSPPKHDCRRPIEPASPLPPSHSHSPLSRDDRPTCIPTTPSPPLPLPPPLFLSREEGPGTEVGPQAQRQVLHRLHVHVRAGHGRHLYLMVDFGLMVCWRAEWDWERQKEQRSQHPFFSPAAFPPPPPHRPQPPISGICMHNTHPRKDPSPHPLACV